MKGFINVIKPAGTSSAFCVSVIKRITGSPCGHLGTLDPMAAGVLPIGVGKASRLFSYTLDKEKEYVAEFRFGFNTDTLDVTGKLTEQSGIIPNESEIKAVLSEFIGDISQIPPKYSAKSVNGKRGYALARAGVDFSLPPKTVRVSEFSFLGRVGEDAFKFRIRCGGGTYIRALARDLGKALNTFAVMSALDRVKSGIFNYGNGVYLDRIKNLTAAELEKYLIPADEAVNYDKLVLTDYQATRLLNGVYENYGFKDGVFRVYNGKEFWGVGTVTGGVLKMNTYVR